MSRGAATEAATQQHMPSRETAASVAQRQAELSPRIMEALRSDKRFAVSVKLLKKIAPVPATVPDARPTRERQQFLVEPSTEALHPRMVQADVNDVWPHIDQARRAKHPETEWHRAELPPSLDAAIGVVSGWHERTESERSWRARVVRSVSSNLWNLTHELRLRFSPPSVLEAAEVAVPHAALMAAMLEAAEMSLDLAVILVVGAQTVGDVPPSGVWIPDDEVSDESVPGFDELDHEAWNEWLMRDVEERARAASPAARADAEAVWAKTKAEVGKGFIREVTAEEMNARFGRGFWRLARRFGIWQGDKIRCCENCAESAHNASSRFHERLWCETADLPARIAAAFAARMPSVRFGMRVGTEDLEAAYRRCLVSAPQLSLVAVWDTDAGVMRMFWTYGYLFGLHSAVLIFNWLAHTICEMARRLGAVACGNYYDDYVVAEPSFAKDSGQWFMLLIMCEVGYPASDEKHVAMAPAAVFLAVRSDFERFAAERVVVLTACPTSAGLARERVKEALATGMLVSAVANKLVGQLGFMTAWAGYRLGKAALQPMFRRAAEAGVARVDGALRASLEFFDSVLAESGVLPPRVMQFGDGQRPTVLIWTDASAEDAEELGRVGFVVIFPGEWYKGVWREERRMYSSAAVPPEVVAGLRKRKTYIGVYEMVAAAGVYTALARELRGRRVVHFVDNQSSMAALCKGYSKVEDMARIVHAFHAQCAGVGVSVWLEYVRSKANVSDWPSRGEFEALESWGAEWVDWAWPEVALMAWAVPAAGVIGAAREASERSVLGKRVRGTRAGRRRDAR